MRRTVLAAHALACAACTAAPPESSPPGFDPAVSSTSNVSDTERDDDAPGSLGLSRAKLSAADAGASAGRLRRAGGDPSGGALSGAPAGADIVVVETLDRDAGCFEAKKDPNCQRSGTFYWDETNTTHPSFHDHLAWAKTIRVVTGRPLLWWQMPLGRPSAQPGGTAGSYRDNRVKYLFSHPGEFAAAGGIGAVFGTGSADQTTVKTDRGQFAAALTRYVAAPALLD